MLGPYYHCTIFYNQTENGKWDFTAWNCNRVNNENIIRQKLIDASVELLFTDMQIISILDNHIPSSLFTSATVLHDRLFWEKDIIQVSTNKRFFLLGGRMTPTYKAAETRLSSDS